VTAFSIPSQGALIEVSFDPGIGHEPRKQRPALVVSTHDFNLMSSLTMVAPITSVDNGYPLHVRITPTDDAEGFEVEGFVCVEQMKALDLDRRGYTELGAVDEHEMNKVLEIVGAIFGI
jgi:mRNA interferase MazF